MVIYVSLYYSGRMTASVKLEKNGKILIPSAMRKELGLEDGKSQVILKTTSMGIELTTRAKAIAWAQAEVRKYVPEGSNVVEEFLAERRAESACEDAK